MKEKDLDAALVGELDITILELMDEVITRSRSLIPLHAFTIRQFMSRHDLKRHKARRILASEVESGFLLTDLVHVNGRTRIWWKSADLKE